MWASLFTDSVVVECHVPGTVLLIRARGFLMKGQLQRLWLVSGGHARCLLEVAIGMSGSWCHPQRHKRGGLFGGGGHLTHLLWLICL